MLFIKQKGTMKLKALILFIFLLLILPSFILAAKKREIILSFGAGYSMGLDSAARRFELDYRDEPPTLIYFKENSGMKDSLNFNLQCFLTKNLGLQLELSRQKASYFCHLEWYGKWIDAPTPEDPGRQVYIEINHIEEPYRKPWTVSSATLSVLFAQRHSGSQRMYPYFFAGVGFYLLSGDEDLVLNRFRYGPKKMNTKIKFGAGLKYRLNQKLGLNLRTFCDACRRYRTSSRYFVGADQFDFYWYMSEEKIGRIGAAIVPSLSYLGIDLSLEFWL